ncbi:23S rRNA (guanosine(2251)-2'-O)-methyltransferase RlmB [Kordiimonas aquimaris]|uniref:23S rRNA (guanosine(2251)-2'-O)-methyltransferase RlmB n=1 Tax=Kordiimonas aquimaris TaxID=707591 RepID=UPI0021CFC2B7|nr:23S rRNA (guanosine(2251)-2'-O)-methyltransferase RlmB [Kordiimonas aquimaris]
MKRQHKNAAHPSKGKPSHKPRGNNQPSDRRRNEATASSTNTSPRENAFKFARKDSYLLYGRNSVEAALANPERECLRLFATKKALTNLSGIKSVHNTPTHEINDTQAFEHIIPSDSPHQGIFLETRPLPGCAIEDLIPISEEKNIILMLDQVTDPHNVGACLRSAAAFGARAVITQDRNSPGESGVLARASAGGLETVPWVRAANLSQALDTLRSMGYWHIGLDGNTDMAIKDADIGNNVVVVMGSEGSGLRPLVRKNCDLITKIPMSGKVESLNVSNAAAIALYQLSN